MLRCSVAFSQRRPHFTEAPFVVHPLALDDVALHNETPEDVVTDVIYTVATKPS